MDKTELIIQLRSKVFADRGTDIEAAWQFVGQLIDGMPESSCRAAAWTAVHVLANTIANAIEALPEFLPAPPDVVRISLEDNPATGAAEPERVTLALDSAALDAIIDSRIQNWADRVLDIDSTVQHYLDNEVDWTEIVRDELRHNISFTIDVD